MKAPVLFAALLVAGPVAAEGKPLELAKRALRGGGSTTKRLSGFAGGIMLSEAARAAFEGDTDGAKEALSAPSSPEFLAALLTFDRSLAAGNTLLGRLNGMRGVRGRISDAVKHNLALASAMTVASAVEIDLGDATYGDLIRLDRDALSQATVRFHGVEADRLGITLTSFAVAVPLWTRVKGVGKEFGKAVGRRFMKTAVVKGGLAIAPVPGSRVAAGGIMVYDVAAGAVDLAGLLLVAHAIEDPTQDLYSDLKIGARKILARRAVDAALKQGDPAEVRRALSHWHERHAEDRNLAYEQVARRDFALARRLRKKGADRVALDDVAETAYGDFGGELALVAQTYLLRETFLDGAHSKTVARMARIQSNLLPQVAEERAAGYAAEAEQLQQWADAATDPELASILREGLDALEGQREAEGYLFEALGVPSAAPAVGEERGGLVQAMPE